MLVYREQRRRERPVRLLADVRRQLDALAPAHPGAHDRTVRLLIDVGVLEAAVADAIHAEADALHPVTAALRRAAMATGHLTWHSWRGAVHDMASWVERAGVAIGAVEGVALPDEVESSVPEGYAH